MGVGFRRLWGLRWSGLGWVCGWFGVEGWRVLSGGRSLGLQPPEQPTYQPIKRGETDKIAGNFAKPTLNPQTNHTPSLPKPPLPETLRKPNPQTTRDTHMATDPFVASLFNPPKCGLRTQLNGFRPLPTQQSQQYFARSLQDVHLTGFYQDHSATVRVQVSR